MICLSTAATLVASLLAGCDTQTDASLRGDSRAALIENLIDENPHLFATTSQGRFSAQTPIRAIARSRTMRGGLDDIFLEMSEQMPDFAGIFIDSTGTLVLRAAEVEQSISPARGEILRDKGRVLISAARLLHPDEESGLLATIRVQKSDYTFAELAYWSREIVRNVGWSSPGLFETDANEALNKVVLVADSYPAGLDDVLVRLGVPFGAVEVRIQGRSAFSSTLRLTVARRGFTSRGEIPMEPQPEPALFSFA